MSGNSELQQVREVKSLKEVGKCYVEMKRQMLKEQRQQISTTGRDLTLPRCYLSLLGCFYNSWRRTGKKIMLCGKEL